MNVEERGRALAAAEKAIVEDITRLVVDEGGRTFRSTAAVACGYSPQKTYLRQDVADAYADAAVAQDRVARVRAAQKEPSAALLVVAHLMKMMREDADMSYRLGFGTRSYELLKKAYEESSVEPRDPFEDLVRCREKRAGAK